MLKVSSRAGAGIVLWHARSGEKTHQNPQKTGRRMKKFIILFIKMLPLGDFWKLSSLCALGWEQIWLLPNSQRNFGSSNINFSTCSGTSGMLKFQEKTSPRMVPAGPQKGQKFPAPAQKFSSRMNIFLFFFPHKE